MLEMTKKECLEKMILLWGYLALNPDKEKQDAYRNLGLALDSRLCPCCDYTEIVSLVHECYRCPLLSTWPPAHVGSSSENVLSIGISTQCPCTLHGSVYQEWADSTDPDAKAEAAAVIEQASILALTKHLQSMEGA